MSEVVIPVPRPCEKCGTVARLNLLNVDASTPEVAAAARVPIGTKLASLWVCDACMGRMIAQIERLDQEVKRWRDLIVDDLEVGGALNVQLVDSVRALFCGRPGAGVRKDPG